MRFIRRNWGLLISVAGFTLFVLLGIYTLMQQNPGVPETVSGTIAFRSDRDGNQELYTWTLNERKVNRLTNTAGPDAHPAFAPNGRLMAYEFLNNDQIDIVVADAINGAGNPVASHPSNDTDPDWSADSQRITFVSDRGETPSIFIVNRQGENVGRMTGDEGVDSAPAWSPDGAEIVFVSNRGGTQDLYRLDVSSCQPPNELDPEGTPYRCTITALTADEFDNTQPDWAPDGNSVLFTSNREGGQAIYEITLRNGNIKRLSDGTQDTDGAYSPEGGRISFTSTRSGNAEIYVYDLARDQLEQLTNSPSTDDQSAWRPDIETDN